MPLSLHSKSAAMEQQRRASKFVKQNRQSGYEDDHASVKTMPENEVRSEYSGVRGGGRKSGQNTIVARPLRSVALGQP